MISIKSDKMTFRDYPPLQPGKDYKFEILNDGQIIGTAHIKPIKDHQGNFWHLDDLFIDKNYRSQGYGTKLLDHLRNYLWSIHKLRIRVHPAIGQQAMENLAEIYQHNNAQYTAEELDQMDREIEQKMLQSDFWEQVAKTSENTDSKKLKEWYRKRGFTHDDPDAKHLWCYPH